MRATGQAQYLEMLDRICDKPGMWLGHEPSLRLVDTFMSGYELGLTHAGNSPGLEGWSEWVWLRFNVYHPAWSLTRIILHSLGSQRAAIAELPKLVRQFLSERDALGGIDGLHAQFRKRYPAFADDIFSEPESTITTTSD